MTGWVTIRGTVFRFMQSFCSTFTSEPRFALRPLLMVFSSTAEYVSIHYIALSSTAVFVIVFAIVFFLFDGFQKACTQTD